MSFVICSSQLADALSELRELKQRNHELEDQFAQIRQPEGPKDALWDHIWQLEREDTLWKAEPEDTLWKAEGRRQDGVLPDPFPPNSRRIGHSVRSLEAAPATAPALYSPRLVQPEEIAPATAPALYSPRLVQPEENIAPVTTADAPVTTADAPILYRLDLPADDLLYRLPTRRVGLVGGGDGTPKTLEKTRHLLNKRSAHASHAILPDRAEIIPDR